MKPVYVVESGKNIPQKNTRVYPFAEMKVGDSFGVPFGEEDGRRPANALRASVTSYATRNPGKKFTVRLVHQDREVRCWRIA